MRREDHRKYLLVLENGGRCFDVELLLVHNFLEIFDPFVQLMIVRRQMRVDHTHRHPVQFEPYTDGAFITLQHMHANVMRSINAITRGDHNI